MSSIGYKHDGIQKGDVLTATWLLLAGAYTPCVVRRLCLCTWRDNQIPTLLYHVPADVDGEGTIVK